MNYKKVIVLTAVLLSLCSFSLTGVEVEKGLSFRSYASSPDLRTSLAVPASRNVPIYFDNYASVAFDLKIYTDKECFGYICRLIIDDSESIDIVLTNPFGGLPYIGVACRNDDLDKLAMPSESDISEWNRITVEFSVDNDSLTVIANGSVVSSIKTERNRHTIQALFGKNSFGRFATSDVAPMAVRDIAIGFDRDREPQYSWGLQYCADESVVDASGRIEALVRNPEWLIERHSRWREQDVLNFATKVFPVQDPVNKRILFITANKLTAYYPRDGKTEEWRFKQNIKLNLLTNDFVVLPDGKLIYFDPEQPMPSVNVFNFGKSRWEGSVQRNTHSPYLHHNTFFNPIDSSIVQLFGYGFHRYLNEADSWRIGNDSVKKFNLNAIQPRYLSAIGLTDSTAYVYGGKGNDKGMQELGSSMYNDLYAINLRDYSVRKLWDEKEPDLKVAASNLLVADDGKTFRGLFFSPNVYKSHLQMKEYDIANGTYTVLADSIAYNFIDVDSEAQLVGDTDNSAYYAIVIEKIPNDGYRAIIYTISLPIINLTSLTENKAEKSGWLYYLLFTMVLASIAVTAWLISRKRRGNKSIEEPQTEPDASSADDIDFSQQLVIEAPKRNVAGIYLLGGFRVINKRGRDITNNFTPIMRQLISLIIFYSNKSRGISNAELKEALWFDKTEESYYNNRGVNIRKIRLLLEDIGTIGVASANGYWFIDGDTSLCDYLNACKQIGEFNAEEVGLDEINALLTVAHSGTLLPDILFESFDRFKAEYTDTVITALGKIRDNARIGLSPEMRIKLADAILLFDSLDEDSVKAKCRALIELKRPGIAQNSFNVFAKEYRNLMGETYGKTFNEFIR